MFILLFLSYCTGTDSSVYTGRDGNFSGLGFVPLISSISVSAVLELFPLEGSNMLLLF